MERGAKVYVSICGKGLSVVADERPDYIKDIAQNIDERMGKLLRTNSKITYDMAAVLVAMNLCDELKQEKLLNRITVDKNETDALKKKLSAAEDTIAELRKQYATVVEENRKEMEKLRLEWVVREKEYLDRLDEI